MNPLDPSTWTWGYELEVSDVPRITLPKWAGTWDGCERDIVNTRLPWRGVAADPLGIEPPVGGEVNTVPTRGWQAQVDLIDRLLGWFREQGYEPGMGPSAHGHIHVHIPGLEDDIDLLKQLACYVFDNQKDMVEICGRYEWKPDMDRAAQEYLMRDGGRMMPAYILNNILDLAMNVDDFTWLHAAGKDGKSMGRPFRYAINMYCLRHTRTIEFRMFRGTLDVGLIAACFKAAEMFMDAALNHPKERFRNLVSFLTFPPILWDVELWNGLQKTKHPENRGKKMRSFKEIQ